MAEFAQPGVEGREGVTSLRVMRPTGVLDSPRSSCRFPCFGDAAFAEDQRIGMVGHEMQMRANDGAFERNHLYQHTAQKSARRPRKHRRNRGRTAGRSGRGRRRGPSPGEEAASALHAHLDSACRRGRPARLDGSPRKHAENLRHPTRRGGEPRRDVVPLPPERRRAERAAGRCRGSCWCCTTRRVAVTHSRIVVADLALAAVASTGAMAAALRRKSRYVTSVKIGEAMDVAGLARRRLPDAGELGTQADVGHSWITPCFAAG